LAQWNQVSAPDAYLVKQEFIVFIELRLSVQKLVEYVECLLRFFDRLGGVTGKSEPLV
jgi:hypothetical protein